MNEEQPDIVIENIYRNSTRCLAIWFDGVSDQEGSYEFHDKDQLNKSNRSRWKIEENVLHFVHSANTRWQTWNNKETGDKILNAITDFIIEKTLLTL